MYEYYLILHDDGRVVWFYETTCREQSTNQKCEKTRRRMIQKTTTVQVSYVCPPAGYMVSVLWFFLTLLLLLLLLTFFFIHQIFCIFYNF